MNIEAIRKIAKTELELQLLDTLEESLKALVQVSELEKKLKEQVEDLEFRLSCEKNFKESAWRMVKGTKRTYKRKVDRLEAEKSALQIAVNNLATHAAKTVK